MKSDVKTALKILGGITIALLVAIAIFAFVFGGIMVNLPSQMENEEDTTETADDTTETADDSTFADYIADTVGDAIRISTSTFWLVVFGALIIVVGIGIIIVLAIFVGCFVCDMKDKPKRGYAIFIAVVSIILSMIAIIITAVASPIFLVMLVATVSAAVYGILSAKRAKAIKQGADAVDQSSTDELDEIVANDDLEEIAEPEKDELD